jgi:O-antigen/teichoic acid export membrane protein
MNLAKTSFYSFIATVVKILSAIIINKAVAVFIGPAGLALIGQYQNFSQLAMTAAKGGINSGVTKYAAEYGTEDKRLPLLFSTAARISLFCSVIISISLIFLSPWLSLHFLKSNEYGYIFIILGVTIFLFVLNGLLLSILNGLKEIRTFVSINIIQSLYSLVFTTLLIVFFDLNGALIALVTNQSIVFVIVLYMLRKHSVIKLSNFLKGFSSEEGKKLFKYALMAITSALTVPISHLIIRNFLGENLGWEQAGYWQAIWSISSMYLMVVTTSLTVYYLPKLSEITERLILRKEIISGYKLILPLVILSASSIYILRDFIISVLFTPEFYQMRELFKWQLIGDVIKISAWLLSFIMIAKAMTKIFIISEIIFALSFVTLALYFTEYYGLVGITYAYTLNYILYFIFLIVALKKHI